MMRRPMARFPGPYNMISFDFRATGKCNICLCRFMGMAKIVL